MARGRRWKHGAGNRDRWWPSQDEGSTTHPTAICFTHSLLPVLLNQLPMEPPGASRMPNKLLKLKIIIAITLFLKASKIQYIYKFSLNQPNLNVENSTSAKQIPKIKLHCKRVMQCKFENEINIRLSKGNSFF